MISSVNGMPKQEKIALVVIFASALVLRLAYLFTLEIETPIRGDAYKYVTLAYNLFHLGIYSLESIPPFTVSTLVTPGYPLFLAAMMWLTNGGDSFYLLTLLMQAMLSAVSSIAVYRLARNIMQNGSAIFASVLFIVSPHINVFSGYLLTETIFIFFLVAGMFSFVRAHRENSPFWFILAGLLWAFGTLVRPALLLLPIVLLIFMALKYEFHKYKTRYLACICSFLLLLVPWHVYKAENELHGDINLLAASIALGGYPDLIYKDPALRGFPYQEDAEYASMIRSSNLAITTILMRAKEEPAKYLKWYLYGKIVTYWQSDIIAGYGGIFVFPVESSLYSKVPIAKFTKELMEVLHPLLVSVALVGGGILFICFFWRGFDNNMSGGVLIYITLCYFTCVHIMLAPLPRYAIPLYPFVYIMFTYTVEQMFMSFRKLGRQVDS